MVFCLAPLQRHTPIIVEKTVILDYFEASLHCNIGIVNCCLSRQTRDCNTAKRYYHSQKLGIVVQISISKSLEEISSVMNWANGMD